MNSTPSLPIKVKAAAERERRTRQKAAMERVRALSCGAFLARTKIEVPVGATDSALVPFDLWPAQQDVLQQMLDDRLIIFLKARQLGISWLACGFVLYACLLSPGQPWLLFSQGQLESNELARRISLMYHQHEDRAVLPRVTKDNTGEIAWSNGSRVLSLPATKKAGRSFTAAGVILDEWAFMLWGATILAAVKPTIDAGGKLFIISSADGPGTAYHQAWQAAESGSSGYRAIFLPWSARPDRGPSWRDEKLIESGGDTASVLREYPANSLEAFTAAADLVYGNQWEDPGNVTEDADYVPDVGELVWALDDGSSGKLDATTGLYPATAHPRVILLAQIKADGVIDVFAELYETDTLEEDQIARALALPYPEPDWAVCDSSAAILRKRLLSAGIGTRRGTHSVMEGIKHMRSYLAVNKLGRRRIRVHPRCKHLRSEFARYRMNTVTDEPVKAFDHGLDALRYLAWTQRHEENDS